jgi:hypothetical protein
MNNNFQVNSLICPYIVGKLVDHKKIKHKILEIINSSQVDSTTYNFKTDWTLPRYIVRNYWEILKPYFENHSNAVAHSLGYKNSSIKNYWFQQYIKHSMHDWHVHLDCQWTNVYYLEFPNGSPKTQIKSPLNPDEIIDLNITEGDIITFPSFVLHRAPQVNHEIRKTIISFNNDFIY